MMMFVFSAAGIKNLFRSPHRYFRAFIFLFFFLLLGDRGELYAQEESDFLEMLNDSAGSNSFLSPQRTSRYLPFSGNETINQKRLSAAENRNNDKGILIHASNLGLLYLKQGNPQKAIGYFEKVEAAARRSKNEKALSSALIELGIAHQQLKENKEAIGYFTEAIPLIEKQKLSKVSGLVNALTAQSYAREKDLNHAIEYYNRAAKIYISLGERQPAAICLNSIGELELRLNDYKKALDNLNAAHELLINTSDKTLEATLYRNLGLVEYKRGQFEKALDFFKHSLALNNQLLVQRLVKDTYMQLFTFYSFRKDFNKADAWHERYRNLKDSLNRVDARTPAANQLPEVTEEKERIIEMLQKQYEEQSVVLNQKQMEFSQIITRTDIELQSKDSLIQEQESAVTALQRDKLKRERDLAQKELLLDRQKNFRNLLLAFSVVALLLVILFYNRYKLKKHAARRLEMSNTELAASIEQLKITQAQLVESERIAEEHARVKQQFLANMSHEIRTPLNAVVGITNLLLEKNPREDQLKYLRSMKLASSNLLSIINDILDLAKIEAGKVNFEHIDYNLHETIEGVYETLRHKAEEQQQHFTYNISDELPEWLVGDPVRLTQILINLAGNALKFTPEKGSVKILCKRIKNGSGKDCFRGEVIDTGIGISVDHLSSIFESFTQASSDTTRKFGGTGLGLTITKQLVELQGGQLGVSSTQGKGTTFWFELPLVEGKEVAQKSGFEKTITFSRPLIVLLAEDQPMNQMVAVDTLESLFPGIRVDIAGNGQEAVELAATNTYDIVLMDIHMPVMDGFEATRRIRAQGNDKLPIVALTANVVKDEIDKCLEAGMDEHLGKPFDPAALKNLLATLVKA